MYLIVKHDFDNMENHEPWYTTIIGYAEDETDADMWMNSQNDKQYKGWDGRMYPYYTKEKIEKVCV